MTRDHLLAKIARCELELREAWLRSLRPSEVVRLERELCDARDEIALLDRRERSFPRWRSP